MTKFDSDSVWEFVIFEGRIPRKVVPKLVYLVKKKTDKTVKTAIIGNLDKFGKFN